MQEEIKKKMVNMQVNPIYFIYIKDIIIAMPCGVKYIFSYINIYADCGNMYVKNTGQQ